MGWSRIAMNRDGFGAESFSYMCFTGAAHAAMKMVKKLRMGVLLKQSSSVLLVLLNSVLFALFHRLRSSQILE